MAKEKEKSLAILMSRFKIFVSQARVEASNGLWYSTANQAEFKTAIAKLCEGAPALARFLSDEIKCQLKQPTADQAGVNGLCLAGAIRPQDLRLDQPNNATLFKASDSEEFQETVSVSEFVAESVYKLSTMSTDESPEQVNEGLLRYLRCENNVVTSHRPETLWTTNPISWTKEMWIQRTNATHGQSAREMILRMIEHMAASVWYDADNTRTLEAASDLERGRVSVVESDRNPTSQAMHLQSAMQRQRIDYLIQICREGRILRTLADATGLGILLSPRICQYVNSPDREIDQIILMFQSNSDLMSVLRLVGEQIELILKKGRPDLSQLFDSLASHIVLSPQFVCQLRDEYGQEQDGLSLGSLKLACDQLTKDVCAVVGKHRLDYDDTIIIAGTSVPCSSIELLDSTSWLDCWIIEAAMAIAPRHPLVKIGVCISLHELTGELITPIQAPFQLWRTKIDTWRAQHNKSNSPRGLIYICPLNVYTDHFTLLEINEQTRMIYHYDSLPNSRHHKPRARMVRQAVQAEFEYLKLGYEDTPTPQQDDSSSCGPMVVRNARKRMNALSIGGWQDKIHPERLRRDIVNAFRQYHSQYRFRAKPVSSKRQKQR